jgi:TalC/MipB family fructose-6-phosphate aldolase
MLTIPSVTSVPLCFKKRTTLCASKKGTNLGGDDLMEIWLDTIDCDAIEDAAKTGIISGVTTNPSILSTTTDVVKTLTQILDIQPGPIAVQVTSFEPEEMIEEGRAIFSFSSRMIVKIPINRNGLIAIKQLHQDNIPILGTGILFPAQALLAANLGVNSIAPYFSHMHDSIRTLTTMIDILRNNQSVTKILAASLKQIEDIVICASLGVEAVTIKPDLYYKLVASDPAVDKFTNKFKSEWTAAQGEISIKDALLPKGSR